MATDLEFSSAFSFSLRVYGFYAELMQDATAAGPSEEPSMGGKLSYAGELDEPGRALVVAGNVSGCASLAATADAAAQKRAIRDGVVDFLVTSLDEALRILKNEIRKRETVAVCVGAAPEVVEHEMRERGVLPDLVRPQEATVFPGDGGSHDEAELGSGEPDRMRMPALVRWSAGAAPALWLPKLDAIVLDCLGADAWAQRRWVRGAPRYLGRLANGVRLLRADREFGAKFIERVRERTERGEIGVPVEIRSTYEGASEEHRFSPPAGSVVSAR